MISRPSLFLTDDTGCNSNDVRRRDSLQGYDLLVGGGLGRTHRNNDTFPRLADPLGYVDKDDILHAVKAIVATQRDYGRRDDRKQVRVWSWPCSLLWYMPTW